METSVLNFLCVSTYFKGQDFLKAAKQAGNNVYLLTKRKLENEEWPWDYIDDTYFIDDWNDEHIQNGIAYKMRSIHFDRFVALDDFDVEKVTLMREHFRMPGMGQTTGRFFRDKLAMRIRAQEAGIPVPAFTALFNDDKINQFADTVPAPWLIKPRAEASAVGIKKVHSKDELWQVIHGLGDDRHRYLAERFAPGSVYHVDGLNYQGEVLFASVSQYLDTPFDVAQGGGIFRSHTVERGGKDDHELKKLNAMVMRAFGMRHGASHTEFIRFNETGEYFFLETSSRVGGANLAEMVEFGSGINLWAEWARIENAVLRDIPYDLPDIQQKYSGIVVSLSRFEWPDTSSFTEPELVWRMKKPWHIGLIVQADTRERVLELLDHYTKRIGEEFHASAPAPDKHE